MRSRALPLRAKVLHLGAPGLWLGALVVLSLVLRWLSARDDGLWRDEGLFLAIVRMPAWSDVIRFLHFHESHPPLFYALMRAWLRISAGSDASALAFVVILGAALVPSIYFAGRRLYGSTVGMISAILAAISPVLIGQASMVRPYPLLQLLVLFSVCSLAVALDSRAVRWWMAFAISTLAMIYTHNWTWLVAAGELAGFAAFILADPRRRARDLFSGLLAAAFIALAFAPWTSGLLYQSRHAGYSALDVDIWHIVFLIPFTLQATILPGVGSPQVKLAITSAGTLFGIAVIVFLIYERTQRRRGRRSAAADVVSWQPVSRISTMLIIVVSATVLALALALSHRTNLIQAQCLSMLTPLWIIGVAAAAEWQWRATRNSAGIIALVALAAAVMGLYASGLNRLATTDKSNARELAAAVAQRSHPTDLVILMPEWLASSFNHYFVPGNEQIDYPSEARENAVDFAGLMPRLGDPAALRRTVMRLREARATGRRVWLISEWPDFEPLVPPSAITMVDSVPLKLVVPVRVHQLRDALISLYGRPDTTLASRHSNDRYEHLMAYLFSPPAGDSAARLPDQ